MDSISKIDEDYRNRYDELRQEDSELRKDWDYALSNLDMESISSAERLQGVSENMLEVQWSMNDLQGFRLFYRHDDRDVVISTDTPKSPMVFGSPCR